MDGSRRLAWLEDYAAGIVRRPAGAGPAPRRHPARAGDFTYPGARRGPSRDVDLRLPAGSVVAIVGENGAGKSTLVKLLSQFYEPTGGPDPR